ncbi:hypothetical protein KFE25_001459 [Diacronema lutheri]|uniref:Uncharacterized protein n=2 Tax=Diacronema lutheri TaxID=2081491 RepID=A0A8J6C7I0_DIALT|nr:hypothetical protein KFE25_001459 [Diacronema lutheri]
MIAAKELRYLTGISGHEAASSPARQQPYSSRSPTSRSPRQLGSLGDGSDAARVLRSPPSPPRIALRPAAPLVSGRRLAELPPPAWPPSLDFRYIGYGDAGPYALGGGVDADADVAFRFDGLDDHTYVPGPLVGGGGFVFGYAELSTDAPRGVRPRSRNRLRLASGGGGLDGGSSAIHPDADPFAPDDTPGPGAYDTPRWPEGSSVGHGSMLGARVALRADADPLVADASTPGPGAYSPRERSTLGRAKLGPGSVSGFSFGRESSRASAEPWRQAPQGVHEREVHMKNVRCRSGGPFALIAPSARHSALHARNSSARRKPRVRVAAESAWPAEWN